MSQFPIKASAWKRRSNQKQSKSFSNVSVHLKCAQNETELANEKTYFNQQNRQSKTMKSLSQV